MTANDDEFPFSGILRTRDVDEALCFDFFFFDEAVAVGFMAILSNPDADDESKLATKETSLQGLFRSLGITRTLTGVVLEASQSIRGFFRDETGEFIERFLVPDNWLFSLSFSRLFPPLVDTIFENEFGVCGAMKLEKIALTFSLS